MSFQERVLMCASFGAVLEEFEIRDALTHVFSTKTDSLSPYASRQQQF